MLYSLTKPLAKAWKPGPEWNTMDITLDGPRTIVMLNGVKVTDYTMAIRCPIASSISSRNAAAPEFRLHRPAKSQRQRHRLLQRSGHQAAEEVAPF